MKRVIAVSDSHGDAAGLKALLAKARKAGRIDAAVFLGDGLADFETAQEALLAEGTRCYAVRGNNDWGSRAPRDETFVLNGVCFYLCHGHEWHVKYGLDRLWYAAQEHGAQVALYGHTHRPAVDLERGMYLVNPGASGYAEVCVEPNGGVRVRLVGMHEAI